MRRPNLRTRIVGSMAGAALALAAVTWLAPTALACTSGDGPVGVAAVVGGTKLAVEGTVASASGGGGTPVVIEVSVEHPLKGTPPANTIAVHDGGACPFHPASGDRVVVAAAGDGQLVGAWLLDGETAVPWIPTTRELTTLSAIHTAFAPPETATPAPEPWSDPRPAVLVFALWVVCLLVLLEIRSARRGT